MTSTVKVNNVQASDGGNIINQCGTNITIGASGDTIALASGASQTGFGRTGTVNWVTTKKTTGFTAVSGEGYFCDTAASGAFTLTLPSSPSAGDIVGFKDYNGNFEAANLTIGRGGSPINGGSTVDPVISTAGASIFLVYVDASQGWVATQDDSSVFSGEDFITATGGTITTCGNFKIHTFTGPGTFTVCSVSTTGASNIVDYLVVAGGGGGGAGCGGGGGAGAGGFRFFANTTNNPQSGPGAPRNGYGSPTPSGTQITVTATSFPITVGGGGTGGTVTGPSSGTCGGNGNPSVFSTVTSTAGGGGASGNTGSCATGNPGGSGGGRTRNRGTKGNGNTPPVTPSQGSDGGCSSCTTAGNGGGGVMAVGGSAAPPATGGAGGAGGGITGFGSGNGQCSSCVQYFAGGGGGSHYSGCASTLKSGAPGGLGGGGGGGLDNSLPAPIAPTGNGGTGTTNTGGGGGGSSEVGGTDLPGANGGSGIVIIRYKFQ
jgi:hypothetical protein